MRRRQPYRAASAIVGATHASIVWLALIAQSKVGIHVSTACIRLEGKLRLIWDAYRNLAIVIVDRNTSNREDSANLHGAIVGLYLHIARYAIQSHISSTRLYGYRPR